MNPSIVFLPWIWNQSRTWVVFIQPPESEGFQSPWISFQLFQEFPGGKRLIRGWVFFLDEFLILLFFFSRILAHGLSRMSQSGKRWGGRKMWSEKSLSQLFQTWNEVQDGFTPCYPQGAPFQLGIFWDFGIKPFQFFRTQKGLDLDPEGIGNFHLKFPSPWKLLIKLP